MIWKNLFAPHILERGYDYYYHGAVESIYVNENSIKAEVEGNYYYEVEILLHDGEIDYIRIT